jgi:hypothetical protein
MKKRSSHRIWSDEDTERLRQHIARGGSLARATVIFDRTEQAMRAHAATLGLKFLTIHELRRRAVGLDRLPHRSIGNEAPAAGISSRTVRASPADSIMTSRR